MLACFIVLFLVIDIVTAYAKKEDKPHKGILNLLLFSVAFCFAVYIAWPYLWKDPVTNFTDSFTKLSHFNIWTGIMLLGGKYVSSMNLPWTYFPTWFLISNPILWLITGFAGFVWAGIAFLGKPLQFFRNTPGAQLPALPHVFCRAYSRGTYLTFYYLRRLAASLFCLSVFCNAGIILYQQNIQQ